MRQDDAKITVSQAAKKLDTYPKHVRRLIDRGELPGAEKISTEPNSPYLIPLKSVEAYIEKKKRAESQARQSAR